MGSHTCLTLARLTARTAVRSLLPSTTRLLQQTETRGKATQSSYIPIAGSPDGSAKDRPKGFDPLIQKIYDKLFEPNGPVPEGLPYIQGYDFNTGIDYEKLFETYDNVGHQATFLGRGIKVLNGMIDCKLSPINPADAPSEVAMIGDRPKTNCTIFLGYTSNMISSGTRELLRYLVQHNMVDCIVSTAGGVEEDVMKCLGPFRLCEFQMDDVELAKNNLPRNGNVLVPGGLYADLDDFVAPIVDDMMYEQNHNGVNWTPSMFIHQIGKQVNNEESVLYWAAKNNIPVFCPALTDGGLGDCMYFHTYRYGDKSLQLDIIKDYRKLIDLVIHSVNTGSLNIGAGITKHHILNPNSFRMGLDFAVYINTALEYDGSDAGAPPEEAISWAKISRTPKMAPVKVATDASIALPIMIAGSFAKRQAEFEQFYAKLRTE